MDVQTEADLWRAPRMLVINVACVVVATIISLGLLMTTQSATLADRFMQTALQEYVDCSTATYTLGDASDYLTNSARLFAMTFETSHVANYYSEVNVEKRRDKAVEVLEGHADEGEASRYLSEALSLSSDLAVVEGRAMRLIADGKGMALTGDLAPLADYELSDAETALSDAEKVTRGQEMLFGAEYQQQKGDIDRAVSQCSEILIKDAENVKDRSEKELEDLLVRQRILTILLLVVVVAAVGLFIGLMLKPLSAYLKRMSEGQPLEPAGAREIRDFALQYNALYQENHERYDRLRHKADHDPLTGLFNRGAYDDVMNNTTTNVALMLVDVDYFKAVNDNYGHDMGDQILKKVADLLTHAFRSTDFPCRIGGDEFAVIVTHVTPRLRAVIERKIVQIREGLVDASDGLPPVTLSIGVAFSTEDDTRETLYDRADRTLYEVKRRGRNGYLFSTDLHGADEGAGASAE